MDRVIFLGCLVLSCQVFGQTTPVPDLRPDERVDVTGDGIADLLITGTTRHTFDPGQGPLIWQYRWVQPLPGTDVLFRTTRGSAGLYKLREGEALSTEPLAQGFRYKQLRWSTPADSMRFDVLESNVELGVNTGWRTGGNHQEGTFVLRSTMGGRAMIAAFTITFEVGSSGKVGVTPGPAVPVEAHFGDENAPGLRPAPSAPKEEDPYDFGHRREPQVIIPPGIPPDEPLDLTSDEIPDVVLTAKFIHETAGLGWYKRGASPLPGTAFLVERKPDGSLAWFQLRMGEPLTPERLAMGLQNGALLWAGPDQAPLTSSGSSEVMAMALEHRYSIHQDLSAEGWHRSEPFINDMLVFRSTQYGRPMIGCFELGGATPGGELWINEQGLVNEGEVLQVQ